MADDFVISNVLISMANFKRVSLKSTLIKSFIFYCFLCYFSSGNHLISLKGKISWDFLKKELHFASWNFIFNTSREEIKNGLACLGCIILNYMKRTLK